MHGVSFQADKDNLGKVHYEKDRIFSGFIGGADGCWGGTRTNRIYDICG